MRYLKSLSIINDKLCLLTDIALPEGHTVDMPVSNPFLTDKLIDEDLKPMMDMQVSEKRRGSALRIRTESA